LRKAIRLPNFARLFRKDLFITIVLNSDCGRISSKQFSLFRGQVRSAFGFQFCLTT
jgi:hypothetical protein